MSQAPAAVVEQAHRLVATARLLPPDEAGRVLEQAVTVLQAAQSQVLAEGERSGQLKDSGCATVRSFAATILRRSVHDASAMAGLALGLACFPRLAQAYRRGEASTGNLRMLMAWTRACGLPALQAHEEQLVDLARRAGPAEMRQFCQHLADLEHPDRDHAKVRAAGLRQVRIHRLGDLAHLDAMLDPAVAEQLKSHLAAAVRAGRRAERAGVGGAGRDGLPPMTRTHGERSADALEDLLTRAMNAAHDEHDGHAGSARTPRQATVTVALETLLGQQGHGQALLARFGLVPAPTARRLACDAVVRLVVTHGRRVLDVGRRQRLTTARQRAALAVTFPTCATPGCGVRFADCDLHHLWWWSLGGPTDADLQVPLCRSHHTWLHDGGYTVTREGGRLVFRDRRGRVVADGHRVLADQLDLLRERRWAATEPADDNDGQTRLREALSQPEVWAARPYDRGRWGWTGRDPAPPPGHAPPRPAEALLTGS